MSDAISSLQVPPVPLPSYGGRDARADVFAENPVAASGQSAAADSIPANRSAGNGLAATSSIRRRTPWTREHRHDGPGLPVAGGFMGSPLESSSTRMKPVEAQPEPAPLNVVVVGSAVAGVGASTLAALLARELTERGCKSVLVDADLNGGGLDVLLGVEDEDGSRFGDISAPLGKVDGKALLRELPVWDGVPLLACNPWRSENPQSWEIQACIRALAQVKDAVIVDAGQWRGLDDIPELAQATHITVVEMTVLGLARAKVAMKSRGTAERQKHGHIVGVEPRGVARGRGVTTLEETEDYSSAIPSRRLSNRTPSYAVNCWTAWACADRTAKPSKPWPRSRMNCRNRWKASG